MTPSPTTSSPKEHPRPTPSTPTESQDRLRAGLARDAAEVGVWALDRIASDPDGRERRCGAHAAARSRAWKLIGAPTQLDIDLDATLVGAHSDEEGAAGTFKGGVGFHPRLAYADQTGEALAAQVRPGNAGANTAADQIAVAEAALAQIAVEHIEGIDLLLRVDSAAPATNCWTGAATARSVIRSAMT